MKFLHLLDLGTCVSNSSLIQCLSWRTGFVKARHFSYQIQALYTADRPICWPITRKTMSALAHTFALGACVLSFLAYRLSIMTEASGRNLLWSRLSGCLVQTCWHLAGPHAPIDLARFKQLLSIIFLFYFWNNFMCLNMQPDFPFVWCRHADIW